MGRYARGADCRQYLPGSGAEIPTPTQHQRGEHGTARGNLQPMPGPISPVQEWLGHASIATTQIYDHRKIRPEDTPTFKVNY
jgi:hypothetical protein